MIDARTLDCGDTIQTDICIVGAGPAGTTLAAQLANTDHNVVLLDAGSETEFDLANGNISSDSRFGDTRDVTNMHGIAGNANAWNVHTDISPRSVRFARFQKADFKARPSLGIANDWPVSYETLEPYWRHAAKLWNLDPDGFDLRGNVTNEHPNIHFGEKIETDVFQFPESAALRIKMRQTIEAAPNIQIITHGAAERVECDVHGNCHTVRIRPTRDTHLDVNAKYVVLAASCMGNCRIMMSSHKPDGTVVGNDNDQLGRNFVEHPLIDGGYIIPKDRKLFDEAGLFDMQTRNGSVRMGHLRLSDHAMQTDELAGLSALLFPRDLEKVKNRKVNIRRQRAHRAALSIRNAIERGRRPLFKDFLVALTGIDEVFTRLFRRKMAPEANVGRGGWTKIDRPSKTYTAFHVIHQGEQLPHPDNRLMLSEETDALGLHRIKVDCELREEDYTQLARSQAAMRDSIVKSGLADWTPATDELGRVKVMTSSTGHHMGATRMGTDPKTSVVDANLKVFGTTNLFALSTGIFPTAGYANPTFTLSALAVRLSEFLTQMPPIV